MRTVVFDPGEPVVIRAYAYDYEAELARALLESHGIPCMVIGDSHRSVGLATVTLVVRRGDVDDAVALLDAPPVEDDDAEPDDEHANAPAGPDAGWPVE